jgi:hypothetical protein
MEEVRNSESGFRIWSKLILIIVIILIILAGVYLYFQFTSILDEKGSSSTNSSNSGGIVSNATGGGGIKINYSNFALEISKNEVIKALPSDAVILLRFYNFDSGERNWEKSYILKRASVEEISDVSVAGEDITLSLHSKYLGQLTSTNFCNIISGANENRDLGFETTLSDMSLAWKYKSVYKYKSCFGM